MINGGWYSCAQPIYGKYLALISARDEINIVEFLAFSEEII
jgi:hypothetical protein